MTSDTSKQLLQVEGCTSGVISTARTARDDGARGKGTATVRFEDGNTCEAEIHWFEAHGIGRRDFKVKKVLP